MITLNLYLWELLQLLHRAKQLQNQINNKIKFGTENGKQLMVHSFQQKNKVRLNYHQIFLLNLKHWKIIVVTVGHHSGKGHCSLSSLQFSKKNKRIFFCIKGRHWCLIFSANSPETLDLNSTVTLILALPVSTKSAIVHMVRPCSLNSWRGGQIRPKIF